MLRICLTVVYTGLMLGANAAQADVAAAQAVLAGDMRKLAFHDAPKPAPAILLSDLEGVERSLADWQGRWVVLNLWATWCAPCRKEMPGLDRLADAMGEDGPAVVTLATGRNPPDAVRRFFAEVGVEGLPVLLDPKTAFAREAGAFGLPVTLLIDPQGREVARLIGDAEWDSADALAMFAALTQP
ncbi:TlpA disulfide reductase family protein [Pseudorhodobacter sp.]|uniref:TlpA family protein disulfide reductase n=1 Tax=Pseudorhodobacter sp. TaxID=1934400 RepID=UPI0026488297|nr:TlpA disulfide reductase family protein [Pseudorhodobacter sp.]MDN5788958.1 TlpA family protein disulfide reductase [Pseudorhodobacter sp.]